VRRLRDFQIVALNAAGMAAPCRAVAVDGAEAVLEPEVPSRVDVLTLPARSTLGFETDRHPVLLSGMADVGPIPGTLRFWITDAVGVRPLRLRPRLNADFTVRVTTLGEGGRPDGLPASFTTLDISAGGIGIAGHAAAPGTLVAIELGVPGLPRAVACRARVVRRLQRGTAVTFLDLDPGVEANLDRLIFTVRQRVARQAFDTQSARTSL
jgi:hypothetical protein